MAQKVLVIEDDAVMAKALTIALRERGHIVTVAGDGVDGLARAQEHPDVIVLDILLPRMNGWEVLRALKSDAALRMIPVVVLTIVEEHEQLAEIRERGAALYLVKSEYSIDAIVEKVVSVLTARSAKP